MSFTVLALFLSLNEGEISLDMEQYGTCEMVDTVFHTRYIISMNAVKPPIDIPHSRTGMNMMSRVRITPTPPMNI